MLAQNRAARQRAREGIACSLLELPAVVNVTQFLETNFPAQMAHELRIVQGMDAAAALLSNGTVVAAVSEERFDRTKKSGAFPFQAIQYCLDAAGATLADVQDICCNFSFGRYRPVYAADPLARSYWQQCLSPDAIFGMLGGIVSASVTQPASVRQIITTPICTQHWQAATSNAALRW